MTVNEYMENYRDVFAPAYSDAIALFGDKPRQLVIEQENSLSHLVKYLDDNSDIENLKRAHNHIKRATLDSYKMIWAHYKKRLTQYTTIDKNNKAIAFNISLSDLDKKLEEFDQCSQNARRYEISSVGKSDDIALTEYEKAVSIARGLISSIDHSKYNSYEEKKVKYIIQNHSVGFIAGIIASLAASGIFKLAF